MSDSEPSASRKNFRLQCPHCKGAMTCDESILDLRNPCCSDCGQPLDIYQYKSLRKLIEEREAAKNAEKAAKQAEEDRRYQQFKQNQLEHFQKLNAEREARMLADQKAKEADTARKQAAAARARAEEGLKRNESTNHVSAEEPQAMKQEITKPEDRPLLKVPTYNDLVAIVALLLVGGALLLVLGIAGFFYGIASQTNIFVMAIGVYGLLMCGLISAFRDMVKNSWKQVILLQEMELRSRPSEDSK